MADVTMIVLTKNEEINLPDCLDSVKDFAGRVVVVDNGGTDRTVQIAREYGADVYEHPLENYTHRFHWGIDNTNINYFFRLGFPNGKEGFVYHWMYHRWCRALVDAKILEQRITNRKFEKMGDLK